MPTSVHYQITPIIELIIALAPSSILDIGAGTGKYGVLAREYLDIWPRSSGYGASSWQHRIDAIEAYEQYITPVHEYVYDHILIGEALSIVSGQIDNYQLVLLIDVLEHMDKQHGIALLETLQQKSDGVLICLPRNFVPQHALFGNPYEIHRAAWTRNELVALGPCHFITCESKLICLMGSRVISRWIDYRKNKIRKKLRERVKLLASRLRLTTR